MGTTTTNLSLFKPGIGESRLIWPSALNDNWDIIDALFNASDQLTPAKGGTGAGALTQGSVPFIGASGIYTQDNTNFFWDDSNNWLGLGTLAPAARLDLSGNTESTGSLYQRVASTTGSVLNKMRRSRGTVAAPTIVSSGDIISQINFEGYDGGGFLSAAAVRALVSATPGANDMPGALAFLTTADSGTSPTEAMRITHQQRLAIGLTAPVGHVHVAANALDQMLFDVAVTSVLDGPQFVYRKARGTLAVPSIVVSGDVLGDLFFQGYDGATYRDAALIRGIASAGVTPGAGDMPGALTFFTTPDGSVTPTEAMRITHQQRLAIGVTAPAGHVHIGANAQDTLFHDVASNVASELPQLIHRRSRTTLAAPAIVQSGDSLGEMLFQGHDGVTFFSAARIRGVVSATPGVNDMPGALSFQTTADGATTTTEAMRITHQQRLGVGIAAPLAHVHVAANALDQILFDVAVTSVLDGPQFVYRKARGTLTVPSIVVSGDVLGDLFFQGYDGATYRDAALIRGIASAGVTPGAGDMPGALTFFTTPDGSVTPLEALRITHQRGLVISEITPDHDIPGATQCVIYARDNGGKTELVAQFGSGSPIQIAIEL